MIFSDREVKAAFERGDIGLEPFPEDEARLSPTTIDLTLDSEIRLWREITTVGEENILVPAMPTFNTTALIDRYTQPHDCTTGFILEPKLLVLGWTVEKIRLPFEARISARVEGKSSLARIGVGIHITAPIIHPGFGIDPRRPRYGGSPIRLEIWNAGPLRIKLTRGMPICQILFENVYGYPEHGYAGQHAVQGPRSTGTRSRRRPASG